MRSYIFQMFQSATCFFLGGSLKWRKTQEQGYTSCGLTTDALVRRLVRLVSAAKATTTQISRSKKKTLRCEGAVRREAWSEAPRRCSAGPETPRRAQPGNSTHQVLTVNVARFSLNSTD